MNFSKLLIMSGWKKYIEKTKSRGVHQFLKMAMEKYAPGLEILFDVGVEVENDKNWQIV